MRNNNNTNNNSPPPTYFGTCATYRLVQQEQQLRVTKRDPIYPLPGPPSSRPSPPVSAHQTVTEKEIPFSFLFACDFSDVSASPHTHTLTHTDRIFLLLVVLLDGGRGGGDANASAHLSAPARAKIKKKGPGKQKERRWRRRRGRELPSLRGRNPPKPTAA